MGSSGTPVLPVPLALSLCHLGRTPPHTCRTANYKTLQVPLSLTGKSNTVFSAEETKPTSLLYQVAQLGPQTMPSEPQILWSLMNQLLHFLSEALFSTILYPKIQTKKDAYSSSELPSVLESREKGFPPGLSSFPANRQRGPETHPHIHKSHKKGTPNSMWGSAEDTHFLYFHATFTIRFRSSSQVHVHACTHCR